MAIVRQHFEPSYKAKDDQIVEVSDAYSLLKVFNKELTEKDSDELIEMYFAGTKIVVFVKSEIDLSSVCNKLEAGFNARGIISDKGNVRLAEIEERNDFSGVFGSFKIFNFEIYTHNLDLNNDEIIVEGQYTEQQKLILEEIANSTSWNFDQYKVEHAMGDKNVLVQAGAGTGKTYSMVSRIAYLCMSRKRFINNLVDEIAMVTFTNEAADNMKLRLKQYFMNCYILTKNKKVLHEIEAVDLMQISTIHKFAKAVLQSNAMEYGLGADFAISSSEYAKEQIYEKSLFASKPEVIEAGMERIKIMGFSYALSAFMDCTIAASRGIGKSIVPTIIVIMGSCVFRVIWVYTIFVYFGTIASLYLLYAFSWSITAIAEIIYFKVCFRKLRIAAQNHRVMEESKKESGREKEKWKKDVRKIQRFAI